MDRILSYLPENVHVRFGWDNGPLSYNSPINDITYRTIVIPKTWLKHGDRGSYHEWSIKETNGQLRKHIKRNWLMNLVRNFFIKLNDLKFLNGINLNLYAILLRKRIRLVLI